MSDSTAPVIAVFGSSTPAPGHTEYDDAFELGRQLALAGFAVASGGYTGTMAAVSQGAASAGGRVIGVTAAQMETYRPAPPNPWLTEEVRCTTMLARLLYLVRESDGIVGLAGGIGTLNEILMAWRFLQIADMRLRPVLLLGPFWQALLALLDELGQIPAAKRALVHGVDTPAAAVASLQAWRVANR